MEGNDYLLSPQKSPGNGYYVYEYYDFQGLVEPIPEIASHLIDENYSKE